MDRKREIYIEQGHCPSEVELSNFFDRQEDDCSVISRHLVGCQHCRETIVQFELFEAVLKHHLAAHEPDRLSQNIRQRVNQQLNMAEAPVRTSHFPRLLFRTAAAFAIISLAVFYGSEFLPSADKNVAVKINRPDNINTTAAKLSDNNMSISHGDSEYQHGIMPGIITENSVPLNDIVGVNYSNGNSEPGPVFRVEDSGTSRNAPATIAPDVHQVWVAKQPQYAANKVMGILKKLKVPDATLSAGNGQFSGNTVMTKLQLVKFVRSCKKAGLNLLSPQAPQPEQHKFRGRPDSIVRYKFDIVTPGN